MNEHIKNVCKIGQGQECCRYLMIGKDGFECAKITGSAGIKALLDRRVASNTITAKGDNCEGKEIEQLN